jgi:hypothetical protein
VRTGARLRQWLLRISMSVHKVAAPVRTVRGSRTRGRAQIRLRSGRCLRAAAARVVHRRMSMQLSFEESSDDGAGDVITSTENQHIDFAALRILATWISQRAGVDADLGTTIDRGFVVAQAHA